MDDAVGCSADDVSAESDESLDQHSCLVFGKGADPKAGRHTSQLYRSIWEPPGSPPTRSAPPPPDIQHPFLSIFSSRAVHPFTLARQRTIKKVRGQEHRQVAEIYTMSQGFMFHLAARARREGDADSIEAPAVCRSAVVFCRWDKKKLGRGPHTLPPLPCYYTNSLSLLFLFVVPPEILGATAPPQCHPAPAITPAVTATPNQHLRHPSPWNRSPRRLLPLSR